MARLLGTQISLCDVPHKPERSLPARTAQCCAPSALAHSGRHAKYGGGITSTPSPPRPQIHEATTDDSGHKRDTPARFQNWPSFSYTSRSDTHTPASHRTCASICATKYPSLQSKITISPTWLRTIPHLPSFPISMRVVPGHSGCSAASSAESVVVVAAVTQVPWLTAPCSLNSSMCIKIMSTEIDRSYWPVNVVQLAKVLKALWRRSVAKQLYSVP